jgi:hypothetical protein
MTVQSAKQEKKEPLFHPGHTRTKIGLALLFVAVCFASLLVSVFSPQRDEFTGNDLR